jgi:hypothetical protein
MGSQDRMDRTGKTENQGKMEFELILNLLLQKKEERHLL